MKWWNSLLGRALKKVPDGARYRVTGLLFSFDGRRSAEMREFSHGETYLMEAEWAEDGSFRARHEGRLVGPFASPRLAENFIVSTAWFRGEETPSA